VLQIGRFRILDELGRGATGVVYRAQDPAINRVIAIKTIRLTDITDERERERMRERLVREAQSAGILSHPNIVTIYDIAEENGLAYIFMECVDGPSLDKVMNTPQALDRDAMLSLLRQTATALDYAHKKGIVHRDIKPANILIHENSVAKITDFGVAKILSQQMTHTGVMMGTPNYMSPEQVQGHAVDGRADEFSLAVIAYEILTGEKPFVADQLPALLFRIVREDPVAAERLNHSLAPQVGVIFRKALAKAAADRYTSCAEFVEALAAACALNPGWHPLPRSSSQSMPTVGGPAAASVAEAVPASSLPAAVARPNESVASAPLRVEPNPPFGADTAEVDRQRNPILKSLVWMLVGLGLVGLVLFGAQKYLFNRSVEAPVPVAERTQPNEPPAAETPKPSPLGTSPQAPAETVQKAPESTAPASPGSPPAEPTAQATPPPAPQTLPEPAKPESPKPKPERKERETTTAARTPPPPAPQKNDSAISVQFVTEPPGIQLVLDGGSTPGCRTPCLLPLSAGRHSLNVQAEGYRPYPRVFNVPQEREFFLQLTKVSGTLSLTSNPPGATIEINGEMQSKRTPAIFNFVPGTYKVRVARNGASLDFDVQLKDGEFVNKRVDF